jgi:small GTP-binding protein
MVSFELSHTWDGHMAIHLFKKSSNSPTKHIKRKVLLLGDEAVGKTSLIRKFVMDKFDDKYIATIGTKVTKKELELESYGENVYLTLMIWDVLGQKGYKTIQIASFRGADGVILVCDFTRKETLKSLEDYWLPNIIKAMKKNRMVFVANKSDLKGKAEFSLADLQRIATKFESECYPSSAKTGENVEDVFLALGKKLVLYKKDDEEEEESLSEELPEEMTVVEATDWVINDFCQGYGDIEVAMPVIRQQFTRAGVDIRNPSKKGLLKVIDQLAEVERGFKDERTIRDNRTRRRLLMERVKE